MRESGTRAKCLCIITMRATARTEPSSEPGPAVSLASASRNSSALRAAITRVVVAALLPIGAAAQDHSQHAGHAPRAAQPASAPRPLGGEFVLRRYNEAALPVELPNGRGVRLVAGSLVLRLATADSGRFEMTTTIAARDDAAAGMTLRGVARVRGDTLELRAEGGAGTTERLRYAWARDFALLLTAADGTTMRYEPAAADSAFTGVQSRGKEVMGVDQYTSSHVFESLPDGGRIVLQRDSADAAGEETIRAHLRDIATRFAKGDFSLPGQVHGMAEVPGTRVMAARRLAMRYVMTPLPRGGEVRIITSDPVAVKAVHEFLAFQRMDHRAAGHDH